MREPRSSRGRNGQEWRMGMVHQPVQGNIFNIQRYSVHDGPGIRTVVFMKGCPLRCKWCSNPESWLSAREMYYDAGKCIGAAACGFCLAACGHGAISVNRDSGKVEMNRGSCAEGCLDCAAACPAQAIDVYGRLMTVDEVLKIAEQDSMFYARSGGGLTLSGGEATAQIGFAEALLAGAKRRRIHTAMETCGHTPWSHFSRLLPGLDMIHYDLKSLNEQAHRKFTGVAPHLIKDNLERLSRSFEPGRIVVRTPVIPGFNDTAGDIAEIAGFVASLGIRHELLKYHRYGSVKYGLLGRVYELGQADLSAERFAELAGVAARYS
ncbi:glycyl-radical enzyme activating protein [Paenibacillus sp. MMS20-IR301]|uniref:glycyl-radical enzyme activating protein n=1 Tax=Paenibacillus sp. MMS20-IR301 TaxID=2895946 RepID=UPI0028E1B115|nr:glycyl-radical enzyme activating protein [Paenibacillus sp. MMS20-IR301]WNS43965.1 glycyl-radical enzyme activating protein [Paenibacillus sp. MMS20-IR301]